MAFWYITYSRALPGKGMVALLLVSGEESHLIVTQAPLWLPYATNQEIGTYRAPLDDAILAETKRWVADALKEPPAGEPLPVAGTPTIAVGLGENYEPPAALADFPLDRPLPATMSKVERRLTDLAGVIRQQPWRTLAVQAAWSKSSWTSNDELQARVTLACTSRESIKIANPATAKDDAAVGLALFIEKVVADTDRTAADQAFARLGPSEVTQLAAPGAEPDDEPQPVITLAPGQELVLLVTLRRHCFLEPGNYRGSVLVSIDSDEIPEEESVRGRVKADAGSFVIRSV